MRCCTASACWACLWCCRCWRCTRPTCRERLPALIGLALGIYGLTQALLQIPLWLAVGPDRAQAGDYRWAGDVCRWAVWWPRWRIVFTASSWAVRCRAPGAIASTVMALVADLTREEQRTKAMALVGDKYRPVLCGGAGSWPGGGRCRVGCRAYSGSPPCLPFAVSAIVVLLVPDAAGDWPEHS